MKSELPVSVFAPQNSAELSNAESFAYGIVNTVRESLLVLDAQLRVTLANQSFYKTFQVAPEDTEKRSIYELGNGQWNIPRLRQLLEETLPETTIFEDFEVEHDFPQIGRKVMLLNARRLPKNSQMAPRILLAIEDITARRNAENTLQIYIKRLEWSNRELQDFAYIASHDLQEPLRAIQAFGERLRTKNGDALSDEGRDYLQRMQNAAGRMRVLIHDLLAFSRVTTKALPFTPVDLNEIAQVAVTDVSQKLEESRGHIELGLLPTLEADATQMRQLLQNLITNALKFHRDDVPPQIKISSQSLAPAPHTTAPHAADQVEITVEDNGIGFEEKHAERIFTPFQRLHSQRKYEGTGIGLAICRKIVERHHGTLTAHSVPDQGTRFVIVLPCRQPDEGITL
jgi:signal transduction histidine kinase